MPFITILIIKANTLSMSSYCIGVERTNLNEHFLWEDEEYVKEFFETETQVDEEEDQYQEEEVSNYLVELCINLLSFFNRE